MRNLSSGGGKMDQMVVTGCIKEFSKVENYIENVMEATNPIGEFYTLKSVIELSVFLLCHSLFLEIFDFHHPFQGIEFANGICSFHYIFYIVFYLGKLFYAPCVYRPLYHVSVIPCSYRLRFSR